MPSQRARSRSSRSGSRGCRSRSWLPHGRPIRRGDAGRLARLTDSDVEVALASLLSAGVVEPGTAVRFAHPILRAAIYGDLSPAERERMHRAAAAILGERGAPGPTVAAHVMQTEPAADPRVVALLRKAAREVLALGDAAGAAALLARALDEP